MDAKQGDCGALDGEQLFERGALGEGTGVVLCGGGLRVDDLGVWRGGGGVGEGREVDEGEEARFRVDPAADEEEGEGGVRGGLDGGVAGGGDVVDDVAGEGEGVDPVAELGGEEEEGGGGVVEVCAEERVSREDCWGWDV